ncbi:Ectopic P granules protein 2 [Caenorhabditis elegans]|uniref:Ectopic P granules protein 2 n=1 Tax=Caenorhabditis elegans TaxID=6239 RepID=EPG2_CAEEL|nr:Ectopic P granules protein 2 [Caenorhabditis elegans]Q95XR4.1 RecName: Full=Ectopic P granules protein 2 [Caenorhabditis elegans]CCD69908.1 Ectopic P granules protein 2 [Caenorhabditis elegans]|eukprot:NP_490955.1 Ectopic P granules protein 2 [Caenorhabditis elegans]
MSANRTVTVFSSSAEDQEPIELAEDSLQNLDKMLAEEKEEHQLLKDEVVLLRKENVEAKTYSTLLEIMLDEAEEKASSAQETTSEENNLKILNRDLVAENLELKEMKEELRKIWLSDSKKFQEALTRISDENTKLQKDCHELESIRQCAQFALDNCNEELEKTQTENEEHESRIETLEREVCEKDIAMKDIVERKDEISLQLELQTKEFTSALNDLMYGREDTLKQIHQMKENWKVKQNEFEVEITKLKSQNDYFDSERLQLTDRIRALLNELSDVRLELGSTRLAMKEKAEVTEAVTSFNKDLRDKLEDEIARLGECLQFRKDEHEQDEAVIAHLEEQLKLGSDKAAAFSSEHSDTIELLRESETELMELRMENYDLKEDFKILKEEKEDVNRTCECLREQLSTTIQERDIEKGQMQSEMDAKMVAVHQQYAKQIDNMKYNHMLAINQELIKGQMALESGKKKHANEILTVRNELEQSNAAHQSLRDQCSLLLSSEDDLRTAHLALESKMTLVSEECIALRVSRANAQKEIGNLTEHHKLEVALLEDAKSGIQQRLHYATIEIEQLKKINEVTQAQFKKETDEKNAEINEFQAAMVSMKQQYNVLGNHCRVLTSQGISDRTTIDKLQETIREHTELAIETKRIHDAEIVQLNDAHKKLVDNLGVEELDEEPKASTESEEKAEWEMVDEE